MTTWPCALWDGYCLLASDRALRHRQRTAQSTVCGQPARGLSVRCACAAGGVGGGADNRIGAEGAAAVARALESGRCGLTALHLGGEWGAV